MMPAATQASGLRAGHRRAAVLPGMARTVQLGLLGALDGGGCELVPGWPLEQAVEPGLLGVGQDGPHPPVHRGEPVGGDREGGVG